MTTSAARTFTRLTLVAGVVFALVLGAFSAPSQAQKIRPDFFGMHDSWIRGGTTPTVKLGVVRLWDTGTSWREVETAPGVYDWTNVDAAVGTARKAGLRPLLVLGQTPQFHMADPTNPPSVEGAYGPGANSMPRLAAWNAYVSAAAKRYGTTVDYQVWNEPNVVNYWAGTVAEMAQLTAETSRTITAAIGSAATVVAPGFPLRLEFQQDWFKKYWQATSGGNGMASYVDVVAVHLYPAADQAPEDSMKLLGFARRVLPKAARSKPLWNTEINYGLLGGPTAKPIPDAKQAAFVARTLVLNAASSVRRMYWYSWGQGKIANTHLVKPNRTTLTPAGRAWNRVRGWLLGTSIGNCAQKRSGKLKGLYTCTARKSSTEVRRIYWKPFGRAVQVATHKTTKTWTSLGGKVTKRKGSYRVKVGYAPIMVTSRR